MDDIDLHDLCGNDCRMVTAIVWAEGLQRVTYLAESVLFQEYYIIEVIRIPKTRVQDEDEDAGVGVAEGVALPGECYCRENEARVLSMDGCLAISDWTEMTRYPCPLGLDPT